MRTLLLALLLCGCASPEPPPPLTPAADDADAIMAAGREALHEAGLSEIAFGITPYVDGTRLAALFGPLLEAVGERVGLPIRLVVGESYEDMQQRATDGSVDVAVLPPYAYVRAAEDEPGLHAFATHVTDGSLSYGAYMISLEDGPVTQIDDLRGQPFGYVDVASTSGFLFPADRMLLEGLHPLDDLEPVFLGDHDRVFDAVLAGEVAAGAVFAGALLEGRRRHPVGERVRVIAKTRRIPCDAYVARAGFPPAAARAFGQALSEVSTRTPEGRRLLAVGLQINGFLPVDDAHYDTVRAVAARVALAVPTLQADAAE